MGRDIALLFHDRGTGRGWVVSSTPRPHFTPGKDPFPFYRRLGGPQGQSGRAKNLVPTGIRSRTVQPVVSRYSVLIYSIIFILIEEWKTNLMSLVILFHFVCAQYVSDINISNIKSLRLCCWITTSVVLFCKDGWFSVSVNLRCIVVCVFGVMCFVALL